MSTSIVSSAPKSIMLYDVENTNTYFPECLAKVLGKAIV